MKIEVDVRGLSCPQPVMRTKAAMADSDVELINVLVSDETSKENIIRFVESRGWKVIEKALPDMEFLLEINR